MTANEQPEECKAEAQAEMTEEEKKVEAEANVEHSYKDYDYRGWSRGVPVPEGWERCPDYENVIRKLKPPAPPQTEPAPAPATDKKSESSCGSCKEIPPEHTHCGHSHTYMAVHFDNQQ
jgi:hypothetical protein